MINWQPEPQRPVWIQVAEIMQERIETGVYQPGQRVPGYRGLAQEFGIAENTARKVLKYLVGEGLVQSVPTWGTFVSPADRRDSPAEDGS